MPPNLIVLLIILHGFQSALSSRWEGNPKPANFYPESSIFQEAFGNTTNPIILTQDGALRGFTMKAVSSKPIAAFQGIPFAQPPIGNLRFRDPVRNKPWAGVRDAIAPRSECIQADVMRYNKVHGEEDCLYLNVYTPLKALESKWSLPVIIFIHGGGFQWGTSSKYGPAYFLNENIVLVTFNYRLGAFGFLSTGDEASSGNQGMKDQVMAMRWVQANIGAFGGDPNSVTIFGQSAGAASVHYHFVSPMSKGLFHRGISSSGSSLCFWSMAEDAPVIARRLGEVFGCAGSTHEMVECLRRIDANRVAPAHLNFSDKYGYPTVFYGPVVEHNHPGAFMVETPEEAYRHNRAADVPWITGHNLNEMAWGVAAMFLNQGEIATMNNHWDEVGLSWLGIRNGTGNDVEIVRRIWEFYFGGRNLTFETRHNLVDLSGDRIFMECGLEAMRYHSRYTGQPVYAYQFSYQGKYSIVQYYGQDTKDWGVALTDNLIYMFNMTMHNYNVILKPEDVDELSMSRVMIGMWTNFATYGRPYLNIEDGIKDVWQAIPKSTSLFSPLRFLDMNLNPRMIDDPYVERYIFWKSLRLVD